MTENQKTTAITDPESLSEAERREILSEIGYRVRREFENEMIAKELARRAQEPERANS